MDQTLHFAVWSEFLEASPVLCIVGISLLSSSEEIVHSPMIKLIFAVSVRPTWKLGRFNPGYSWAVLASLFYEIAD